MFPFRNSDGGKTISHDIHKGQRFDVGVKYGLFSAQLALATHGRDRDKVLTEIIQVLASREQSEGSGE